MIFAAIPELTSYIVWSIPSVFIGVLVAVGLTRWAGSWSLAKRVLISLAAATFPNFGLAGFLLMANPRLSVWFSLDEFLIPFSLQIALILVITAPLVWLVSRRIAQKPVPTDVFE